MQAIIMYDNLCTKYTKFVYFQYHNNKNRRNALKLLMKLNAEMTEEGEMLNTQSLFIPISQHKRKKRRHVLDFT